MPNETKCFGIEIVFQMFPKIENFQTSNTTYKEFGFPNIHDGHDNAIS